jgi:TolA-binding protein
MHGKLKFIPFALGLLAWVQPGGAQTESNELARQHLESGIQFYNQQKFRQALNDFNIIVTSMAATDVADNALLKIGEYYLEIEEAFPKARESFEGVLQRYPTSDSAPGAYYNLGLLTLRSTRGREGVDDALANFQRVGLYPRNPWLPAALNATGMAHERALRWQDAFDSYARVVAEYPASEWAAAAQLALGLCTLRLGDPLQAMVEIQLVRNRFPESREAERALGALTLLYRLYGLPKLGKAVSFKVDPTFTLGAQRLKGVAGIRVSSGGLQVLDSDRKQLLSFDEKGKLIGSAGVGEPRGLTIDARGTVIVANEKGLLVGSTPVSLSVPEEKGPKPLEKIRAAVRDRLGDLFVYDADKKQVLRFDREGRPKGPFPNANQRELQALEMDETGNLYMLDRKERAVAIYRPDGQAVANIPLRGQSFEFKKPAELALDPTGFLYVLDEESQIAIFDPAYQLVARLASANLGGGALKKPRAIDVAESGDIYVYDDDLKSVLRLR